MRRVEHKKVTRKIACDFIRACYPEFADLQVSDVRIRVFSNGHIWAVTVRDRQDFHISHWPEETRNNFFYPEHLSLSSDRFCDFLDKRQYHYLEIKSQKYFDEAGWSNRLARLHGCGGIV